MHSFAQKPKATLQVPSAKSTTPYRSHFAQSREESSILSQRRTIGDQAVQRSLQVNATGIEVGPSTAAAAHFAHDFSLIPVYPDMHRSMQKKLKVNAPGDMYEQEADRIADQMVHMSDPKPQRAYACGDNCPAYQADEGIRARVQSKPARMQNGISNALAPPIVHAALASTGRSLDSDVQEFMESQFGQSFSHVRVHTDPSAQHSAQSIGARAYTVGSEIVFGAGQYVPATSEGRRLLAHELTHVMQQSGLNERDMIQRDMYAPGQRRAMSEGRVSATALDMQIVSQCNFQPGDIVFRLGSQALASYIQEPVTHGGIYLGNGLIHDMVGFGNRTVPLVEFFAETADASVVRIVRFTGPLANIIVPRVVRNIQARDFDLPTDPVPWNLFSSARDYRTANCLEYSHAQFLYAIRQMSQERALPPEVQGELRSTYFASGRSTPSPLIAPRSLQGYLPVGESLERRATVIGADILAEDVDPAVFRNRWEGDSGSSIESFTYRSFVNATRFFTALACPHATGDASNRFQQQVLPIGSPQTRNVTDPIDRTVTTQTGIAWATHSNGNAYLVLMTIQNSSISPGRTQIFFRTFVDNDLRDRALARAAFFQPRGVQVVPWSVISGIPGVPSASAAVR